MQPYIVKLLVDTLGAAGDMQEPALQQHAMFIGFAFLGLRLIIVAAWWAFRILRGKIEPSVDVLIRTKLLEHLFRHSYAWFLNSFAGRTGQRIDTAARSFRELFLMFGDMTEISVRSLTILTLLLVTDWRLGTGMLIWILLFLPLTIKLSTLFERRSFDIIKTCGLFVERVVDACSNIFAVRSNGGGVCYERAQSIRIAEEVGGKYARIIKLWNYISSTRSCMNTLLYCILFIVGFWRWRVHSISIGDFAMALSAGILTVDLLDVFSVKTQHFSQMLGSLRESLEGLLTDLPPPQQKQLPAFQPAKGAVSFKNISFAYNAGKNVLHNFSFNIEAGEKVALVGPSGAGKSTLISLLLGLWNPQEGQIIVDGQDAAAVDRESLLQQIAVIPQDTSLFHRTLFENIAYGSHGADQASVEAAARAAHIHDFIVAQPQGYQTLVGERGLKLSGGQRQRIAVARAIHKNAPILLLDEATSALDSESEQAIQDALHRLIPEKTVLAIAHRLSTIADVDRIVVLEAGRIVEQGSHAQLLESGGRYAKLWAMQSGGYLPEPPVEEWDVETGKVE